MPTILYIKIRTIFIKEYKMIYMMNNLDIVNAAEEMLYIQRRKMMNQNNF
jgi:hypothetical protein